MNLQHEPEHLHPALIVRVGSGFIEVPLTGDSAGDEILLRFAERGGSLVLERRAA